MNYEQAKAEALQAGATYFDISDALSVAVEFANAHDVIYSGDMQALRGRNELAAKLFVAMMLDAGWYERDGQGEFTVFCHPLITTK